MKDALHDDFAFEPVPGLPALLPEGESIVWQGAPAPIAFAVEVMRLRFVAVLIALLVIWRTAAGIHDGIGAGAVAIVAGGTLLGGLIALGLLALSGWLMARGTIYTITTQRLVIRHGVAMPMAINIPFAKVAGAAAAPGFDGTSSIALSLLPKSRSSFIALWPHVRPFQIIRPEPTLRAIADGARVAGLLTDALSRAAGQPAAATARPAPTGHREPEAIGISNAAAGAA